MFVWDPRPVFLRIPGIEFDIYWYAVLFAAGFAAGVRLFTRRLSLYFRLQGLLYQKPAEIADKVLGWMVVATVVGARLGHLFFYEAKEAYLQHPEAIFALRKGGLSSHGAVVGIVVALFWLARREKKWGLSGFRLLDLAAISAGLVGACIRLGNFINQEVVGTPTGLPWGVIFAHPLDGSLRVPRHPVQLYESIFYLAVFAGMWVISRRREWLLSEGRLLGLFLALTFGFRIVAEAWKVEQSAIWAGSFTMGQVLSVPLVLVGLWLCRRSRGESRAASGPPVR